jgi:hypothetical protein
VSTPVRLQRRAIDVSASDTADFKIETDNRVSVIFFRFADQRLNSRRAACRSLCAAYADRRCPALNSYHHPTLNSGRRALREVALNRSRGSVLDAIFVQAPRRHLTIHRLPVIR